VSGVNAYYVNGSNHYQEMFVGLENIFKILRVDFVSAYQNGKYFHSAFVVGAGGLLGSGITDAKTTARRAEIDF
jgi:hypothetical protein